MSRDTKLSKNLSWILRHGADSYNLNILDGGFISVKEILQCISKKDEIQMTDILRIVENDSKKRFSIRKDFEGNLQIRANQGHTMRKVKNEGLLTLIQKSNIPTDTIIHGTYMSNWLKIKEEGLKRMGRNHIHFATGLPESKRIMSGMRKNAEVFIQINVNLAMDDGYQFYLSENGVVLCEGDRIGCLPTKYFLKVWSRDQDNLV